MRISFVGDIMLGRFISDRYDKYGYDVISPEIKEILKLSDYVFGNLESPISNFDINSNDHLAFRGNSKLLNQFSFINCFSLSNNHINDFGKQGMDDTIAHLNNANIEWNGLYRDDYKPFIFEVEGRKFALFTCTDMMNIKFDVDNLWKTLKIDDEDLDKSIKKYKSENYFVILFAHVGMLFTRFPNPPIRTLLQQKVESGADVVVTVHSHVLGGMEYYKGKPIFHSIGDFVMDGNSYRRRRASILHLNINFDGEIKWEIIPTIIDLNFKTVLAPHKTAKKMIKSWNYVSRMLAKNQDTYSQFFKKQYRIEILQHVSSTLSFLLRTKGFIKTLKLVLKRKEEVKKVKNWASTDRKDKRFDDDAIDENRTKFSQKELFDID